MNFASLIHLGESLLLNGYRFVAVTPGTHARAIAGRALAKSVEDIFGWNLEFERESLSRKMFSLLRDSHALLDADGKMKSLVSFATLNGDLFAHSGYPTLEPDAVTLGPDTYRYAAFLKRTLRETGSLLDLGCGSGAGGLAVRNHCKRVVLADLNPLAMQFASANVAISAASNVEVTCGDLFQEITETFDTIVANPPCLRDRSGHMYRDGGGPLGIDLAVRIINEAPEHLNPGGSLLLYTCSHVLEGKPALLEKTRATLENVYSGYIYEEIDPDAFSDELAAYPRADRIAIIGIQARK